MSLIPTIVVLGGYNSSDQNGFYSQIATIGADKDYKFANLSSIDAGSAKDCMKRLIDQLLPSDYINSLYGDYDIEKLVVAVKDLGWTSNKIVITIPQFESFPVLILQKIIKIFAGRVHELPLYLVFGISTTMESVVRQLEDAVFEKLNITKLKLKQSYVSCNRIVDELLIQPLHQCKLGGEALKNILDHFDFRDFSTISCIRKFQYCLMTHFYGNPISIFCIQGITFNEVSAIHYNSVRMLPSFTTLFDEIDDFNDDERKFYRSLLLDNEILFDWISSKINDIYIYNERLAIAIKIFRKIEKWTTKTTKPIRTLYKFILLDELISDNHFLNCISLFKYIPKSIKSEFIDEFTLEFGRNSCSFPNEIESLQRIKVLIDALPDTNNQIDEQNLVKEWRMKQKTGRNSLVSKHAGKLYLDSDGCHSKIHKELTNFFKLVFSNYKDLPLHEIMYFQDKMDIIPKTFNAESKRIISTALNYPYLYLDCSKCKESPELNTAHLPDISIMYKIYLEAGKMINLRDWFEAFKVVLEGDRENQQGTDLELQGRFTKGIKELKFLGYIKKTGRKFDYVYRQTWGE